MGEVYLADDTHLQRKVALKFLPSDMLQDETAHQRFRREAKSAAALDHPYICHINEVGTADGKDFIVMEYVDGVTLEEKLNEGPLPLKEAQRIAMEIAEALEAAHQKGIVHRDLKPANIMLTRSGHAKVMDFGVAKKLPPTDRTGNPEETYSAVTQSGAIVGTLAYASPEQLQGKQTDARSDIFSFGIVFYEMLAGHHPFRRASVMETASAILNEPPPPVDRNNQELPGQLHDIFNKLLAKNPDQRYQSVREVHENLNQLLKNGQVVRKKRSLIRPIRITVALIVFIFCIAPAIWWIHDNYFISPQAALAFQERDWILIADFENLTGDTVFDRSLQTALDVGIEQSQYINVYPEARIQETLQRMHEESGTKLNEKLACEIAVREGIKAVLACSISKIGSLYSITARLIEPNKRTTVLSRAVEAKGKDQVLPALDSLVNTVRKELGESLQKISYQRLPLPKATTASLEALKIYADAKKLQDNDNNHAGIELLKQAVEIDPEFAMAHAELGMYYYMDGDRDKGEKHFTTALSLVGRLTSRERLWIRAIVEDWRGNLERAVDYYRTYLSQYSGDEEGWYRLGWVYMARQGRYDTGIEAFKKVLEINSSNIGALLNIGTCYSGLGKYEEAIENYEKGFTLRPSDITGIHINGEYGFTLVRLGDLHKAADTFQKMIDAGDKARGYRSMALLAMYQGKLSESIDDFKQAILINRAKKVLDSEYRDHIYLASVYRLKGLNEESTSELARANRIISQSSLDPSFLSILAKNYARIGKTSDASKLLKDIILQAKNLTAISALNRTDRGDQADINLIKGEVALANGRVDEAIESFELSLQLESGYMSCIESLAFAYSRHGDLQSAADKYRQIIAAFPLGDESQEYWILSHYELAKIYEQLGDMKKAKEYYGKFFNIWKDADPGIPVLRRAKAEYAELP